MLEAGAVDVDMELHPRCPDGVAVKRHLQKSRRKAQEAIENLLGKYSAEEQIRPEQITILTAHTCSVQEVMSADPA